MKNFLRYLEGKSFRTGEPLEKEAVIVAQKVLYNMGLDFIPATYIDFLKHYNGIKANGCYLFGATVDDDLDIIDQNEHLPRPENAILLGRNEFDYLVYDYVLKEYQVVDCEDFEVLEKYKEKDLGNALNEIFNV